MFETAVKLIAALPEDSPEAQCLIRAYDAAPESGYPDDLAFAIVNVFRQVDPGYAEFFRKRMN